MKIFIRTTGERSLTQFDKIEYEILLDEQKTGCKGYFEQMKKLSTIDDDVLLLEDDIQLKKTFFKCLNDTIEMSNNKYIINMSQPSAIIQLCEPKQFYWTRAVYYPRESIKKFMAKYDESYLNESKYYDIIQQHLLIDKYIGVPSIMNLIDLNLPSIMTY